MPYVVRYPPVPLLWPREATCDQVMDNPIYDETAPTKQVSVLSKLFGSIPIDEQPTIKIKKGTKVIVFPSVLHYDDRLWVKPHEFYPQRWDKQPDILAGGDTPKVEVRNRQSTVPGLMGKRTSEFVAKRRESLQKVTSKATVSESLRAKVFGSDHENDQAEATNDHLFECTLETNRDLQAFSFVPFGLGAHACLGRRLAVRMVDSIVFNFLEHDVKFYNGIIPSLFTRKQWYERTIAAAAAYNYPADPVHVQIRAPIRRKVAPRQSCFRTTFSVKGEIEKGKDRDIRSLKEEGSLIEEGSLGEEEDSMTEEESDSEVGEIKGPSMEESFAQIQMEFSDITDW